MDWASGARDFYLAMMEVQPIWFRMLFRPTGPSCLPWPLAGEAEEEGCCGGVSAGDRRGFLLEPTAAGLAHFGHSDHRGTKKDTVLRCPKSLNLKGIRARGLEPPRGCPH